ncbi:hypothetical protein P2W68_01270 [Chryseobacterium arthrosphaerae]|uniref:hypothetical protein n=1 Tax=Chryseobacterium arthrosphaerae TaxID=651561 RepID=UPI0023E2EA3A|nr:hypothetical protein [Chryseobacterium arthrosphaerae]WES98255.1 hypothetical protein P2W68_01270 [Chryseobacterium arthrosphaerae]
MNNNNPKENTKGLLYSAYHKLYSALSSLEKFEKGINFFDNISHLDNFFSEYRNVTFMLQKSLAHTQFLKVYEENRQKYLLNDACKWFIEKRNEVLKQQPFDLEKRIRIVVYSTNKNVALPELSFTIENDVEFSSLINSMQNFFIKFNLIEVMFSAEFSFYERGSNEELYDNFISGINNMKLFMKAMKEALNENDILSDQLEKKIDDMNFHRIPKNMLLTDDYVFYTRENRFEKASRAEFSFGQTDLKVPVTSFEKMFPGSEDLFSNFIMMHLAVFKMQKTIMPTCFIVYNDEKMKFMSFDSSIKTTVYRKLNEIANRIETEGIIEVLYVGEMYLYSNNENILNLESSERIKHKHSESLVFFKASHELTTSCYLFDSDRIDDMEYIASVLHQKEPMIKNLAFMNPVINEFKRLNLKK